MRLDEWKRCVGLHENSCIKHQDTASEIENKSAYVSSAKNFDSIDDYEEDGVLSVNRFPFGK